MFEFVMEVDRPTQVERVIEDNGLPPNAYDLVLTAREAAGRAAALLDGGTAESRVP